MSDGYETLRKSERRERSRADAYRRAYEARCSGNVVAERLALQRLAVMGERLRFRPPAPVPASTGARRVSKGREAAAELVGCVAGRPGSVTGSRDDVVVRPGARSQGRAA